MLMLTRRINGIKHCASPRMVVTAWGNGRAPPKTFTIPNTPISTPKYLQTPTHHPFPSSITPKTPNKPSPTPTQRTHLHALACLLSYPHPRQYAFLRFPTPLPLQQTPLQLSKHHLSPPNKPKFTTKKPKYIDQKRTKSKNKRKKRKLNKKN